MLASRPLGEPGPEYSRRLRGLGPCQRTGRANSSRRQISCRPIEVFFTVYKEKERAHKEAKETVQDLASRTDEDLRREILRRLELRHVEELREAELRLKSL